MKNIQYCKNTVLILLCLLIPIGIRFQEMMLMIIGGIALGYLAAQPRK